MRLTLTQLQKLADKAGITIWYDTAGEMFVDGDGNEGGMVCFVGMIERRLRGEVETVDQLFTGALKEE